MDLIKLVVLTDTHANWPALQAALAVIQRDGYDLLVHTGDAIGSGRHSVDDRQVPYNDTTLFQTFEARRVPERDPIYRDFFGGRFGG